MTKPSGGWQGERGTRHERGYDSKWDRKAKAVRERDMGLCQPCLKRDGRPTPSTQTDHIIPKSQGGTDDWDNLQGICDECHRIKSSAEGSFKQHGRVKRVIGLDGWPVEG